MDGNDGKPLCFAGRRFHLSGIAGVGMSALAQALLDADARVSGSDRLYDHGDCCEVLGPLLKQGVAMRPQDGSGVDADCAALVVSTAIEGDNPEVAAATARGVETKHRAAVLADLTQGHDLIAVTGTCGKTSVTAMLGHLLACCGFDPTVVNGAPVVGWGSDQRLGSVRKGHSGLMVLEADESDRSLLNFNPHHAIVTNASADHFSLEETRDLFRRFKKRVSGGVIAGDDDWHAPSVNDVRGYPSFSFKGKRFQLKIPGDHNALNAAQAVEMAHTLGANIDQLADALARFEGVSRRMEKVSAPNARTAVYDDMAHNPEKLRAAWLTLTRRYSRVAGVWRPHGYGPLKSMLPELAKMFAEVVRADDLLLLLPVYDAGGSADRCIATEELLTAILERGGHAGLVSDIDEAESRMRTVSERYDALVTLGARDPDLPRLARRLRHSTIRC